MTKKGYLNSTKIKAAAGVKLIELINSKDDSVSLNACKEILQLDRLPIEVLHRELKLNKTVSMNDTKKKKGNK